MTVDANDLLDNTLLSIFPSGNQTTAKCEYPKDCATGCSWNQHRPPYSEMEITLNSESLSTPLSRDIAPVKENDPPLPISQGEISASRNQVSPATANNDFVSMINSATSLLEGIITHSAVYFHHTDELETSLDPLATESTSAKKVIVDRIPDGKYKWNKRHHCHYFNRRVRKMARHLQQMHKEKMYVQESQSLPKKSKSQKLCWKKIINNGYFVQNQVTLKTGNGILLPQRRVRDEQQKTDIFTVSTAGECLRNILWSHEAKCNLTAEEGSLRRVITRSALSLTEEDAIMNERFKQNVIPWNGVR